MHLWPSLRIRDSFKLSYLKKTEWNLLRMKIEQKSSNNQNPLLDNQIDADERDDGEPSTSNISWIFALVREFLMIISCCYCCFCCGACYDQEEK